VRRFVALRRIPTRIVTVQSRREYTIVVVVVYDPATTAVRAARRSKAPSYVALVAARAAA
jgi:hypothetical protein